MGKCEFCAKEVVLPYHCAYCAKHFCKEHRLPESHECFGISVFPKWQTRYYLSETEKKDKRTKESSHLSQISAHVKEKQKPKESTPQARTRHIKKTIIILMIIVAIVLLGLFLVRPLLMPTPTTVYVKNIPFEDDFHLSKNILSQGGTIEYQFDVTHNARKIDISIISTEAINFKLISRENGTTIIEKDWMMLVSSSPLLQKGTWIVQIKPFYSKAEGIITLNYGVMSWAEFIDFSALRENSEINLSYKDDLNETVSVYISIKTKVQYDWIEVQSYTVDGIDRNDFTRTWTGENKDYIVYFTVNHELFGEVKWSQVLVAPFSPP